MVYGASPHCYYGFTDMEPKAGHVLFTSMLMVEGAQLLGTAIQVKKTPSWPRSWGHFQLFIAVFPQ